MKAKISPAAFYADCPECNGPLLDPDSGAHTIHTQFYNKDHSFECEECGQFFKLEAKAWR